jgi:polygalacturonase
MMTMLRTATLALLLLCANSVGADQCEVTAYGAKPGDETLDTPAIQAAIDACAARGGGRVLVPAGRFRFGTLMLASRIELHLAAGAVLEASGRIDDHPILDIKGNVGDHGSDEGGLRGLIVAHALEDVAITGHGLIDGNGDAYWEPGFIGSGRSRPSNPRPRFGIWFLDSKRVTLEHFHMRDPPMYFITSERSEDVVVDGIRLDANPLSPNSDGIQIEGGSSIRIANVAIRTGDDAIVLKSKGSGPVEDVSVTNSYLQSDDSAFKFGTGTALSMKRVLFADSIIARSRIGIAIFMKDGGTIEQFTARGIEIDTASRHATDYPIYLDLDRRDDASKLGTLRDITLSDIRIRSRGNILVNGHPDAHFENLTLRAIDFRIVDPVDLTGLRGKPRGNALLKPLAQIVDYARVDAHVTIAHVDGLTLDRVTLRGDADALAAREPFVLEQVRDLVAIETPQLPKRGER